MTPVISPLLPVASANIHIGLPFNYHVHDVQTEAGKVDFVWGSDYATSPPGVHNTYYFPYNREPSNGHNLAWFQVHHPDWIEYQCDRTSIAYDQGNPQTVPLDVGNPAVLDYMLSTYIIPNLHAGYAGVAFDNVELVNQRSAGSRCGHFTTEGRWVRQYTGQVVDTAFQQVVLGWAHIMYMRVHATIPRATVSMNFSFTFAAPRASYALYQYMDIDSDERGFSNWGLPGDNVLTGSNWLANTLALQKLAEMGRGLFSINQEPEAFADISTDEVQWVLANYLLVRGASSFVYLCGAQQYGYLFWRPEYEARIGAPAAAMIASQHVYMRPYTHGLALVNPSVSQAYSVEIGPSKYQDLYGTTLTSGTVTLLPHTGIVLLAVG